jgi:hypothetical protein
VKIVRGDRRDVIEYREVLEKRGKNMRKVRKNQPGE